MAGRVVADGRAARGSFGGLFRIGIDEISYRRGHKYLMVVVDHDTGRLVWAEAGHDRATLQEFFDLLGPERASKITLISADAAEWFGTCALAACENATLCHDPFTSFDRDDAAVAMLDDWLAWARRSQIPALVELYHRIKKHLAGIVAAVTPTAFRTGSQSRSTLNCACSPGSPPGSNQLTT